jgi:hypothetical protein
MTSTSNAIDDPFSEYRVIGKLTTREKADLLRELGDDEAADTLEAASTETQTKSLFGGWAGGQHKLEPWQHTSHTFGFLPAGPASNEPLALYNAAQIRPDRSLRDTPVTIRLDKLRVAGYPGKGVHRILFDFYARNALEDGQQEHLHYNATFRAREGQEAAVVGLPVFVNLNVGELGLAFKCNTVNVANEGSQKALDVLESDLVRSGLELAKSAQPAIGPLSQIAMGLTKAILGVHKNVRVQEFELGLDLDDASTGARLAEGSYFALQVDDAATWDWSQWVWHPSRARLTKPADVFFLPGAQSNRLDVQLHAFPTRVYQE